MLPSIYQIELTPACNLACPMCYRSSMVREIQLLDFTLLEEMASRGEFANTRYVELQLAGEPTIHPDLGRVVRFIHQQGLWVGLSTHGLNMRKPGVRAALLELDALTISVDSVVPEIYTQLRHPAHFADLEDDLEYFMALYAKLPLHGRPVIDFQVVETPMVKGSGDLDGLRAWVKKKQWDGLVRTRKMTDCFTELNGLVPRGSTPRPKEHCTTPWNAVTVLANGDVVSCCFVFDTTKEPRKLSNWYGTLREQTLAEIWCGERVKAKRREHETGQLTGNCAACYQWSPEKHVHYTPLGTGEEVFKGGAAGIVPAIARQKGIELVNIHPWQGGRSVQV